MLLRLMENERPVLTLMRRGATFGMDRLDQVWREQTMRIMVADMNIVVATLLFLVFVVMLLYQILTNSDILCDMDVDGSV